MPIEHLESTEMGKAEKPRVTPLHGDDRVFSLSVSFFKKEPSKHFAETARLGFLNCWRLELLVRDFKAPFLC